MCSMIKVIYLLLALHGVRSKEGAILDYVEGRNDRPLTNTTTESTTIVNDQSERAVSTTESVKETTTEMVTVDKARLEKGENRSEESTEHTKLDGRIAVNENDNKDFESTVSQTTTTDDVSSFIEVEEQKARDSSDDDGSEEDVQISDLFGKNSTENESREETGSDSHEATGSDSHETTSSDSHKIDSNDDNSDIRDINDDDIITIKMGAPHKKFKEEDTTEDVELSVKPSSKNELVLEDTFKSDTADLLNSSLLTRRMLGGYAIDFNGKSSRDSLQVPEILIDNESHEPQELTNHKDNLPLARTTSTSTLSLPSEINHSKHINSRLDKPQNEIPTSAVPEVLLPLFRNPRPTKPTLIQQIQPYLQALATTRLPVYNQYQTNVTPIFQRLQQVTEELRLNMAQQYADLYRNQWNPLPNNIYNNRNVY